MADHCLDAMPATVRLNDSLRIKPGRSSRNGATGSSQTFRTSPGIPVPEMGKAIPGYLAKSNLRFEEWILDTCLCPYDQDWIDYQQEIALRHTGAKKNHVDGVQSTSHVPLRDVMAFIPVMNLTTKPYLAANATGLSLAPVSPRAIFRSKYENRSGDP